MRTIQVKDSDRYGDYYSIFNKVKVYVGETKAEHDAKRKEEYDLYIIERNRYREDVFMGYSGFDQSPDKAVEWDEVV